MLVDTPHVVRLGGVPVEDGDPIPLGEKAVTVLFPAPVPPAIQRTWEKSVGFAMASR
jgi:hypothetical protein